MTFLIFQLLNEKPTYAYVIYIIFALKKFMCMNEISNADLQVYNNAVMLMTKLSKFIHNIQFEIYNKKTGMYFHGNFVIACFQ